MDMTLAIVFRWLHIAAACLAIGGAFFIRVLLPRGLSQLEPEVRKATFLRLRRAFKRVVHSAILLLIISGIYNSMGNWNAYDQAGAAAHAWWGMHVLLATGVFAIALYVLMGKEPPAGHAKWMAVNLILMALLLVAAAGTKYVREHRREAVLIPNLVIH